MKPTCAEMSPESATKTSSTSKDKGAFTAFWLTIMMAAQSFKKRTRHSSSTASARWRDAHRSVVRQLAIQEWIKEAKDVVRAESMHWITNASETIELVDSDATQVHSFADPDDSRMCIELDDMIKLGITHTDIRSKLVRIFNEHGAAAPQYDALSLERITRMTW